MDNSTISRRGVVALLGATTALAACGESQPSKSGTSVDSTGRFPSAGFEPNVKDWPSGNPDGLPDFKPRFITLMVISSAEPWKISVNHASFEALDQKEYPLSDDARQKKAIAILEEIANSGKKRKRLADSNKYWKIYKRLRGNHKDLTDIVGFNEFGSNQQSEIYIWIDCDRAKIDPAYVISFSPKSGFGEDSASNDSFYSKGLATTIAGGPVIVVRNYFSTHDEKATPKFAARNSSLTIPPGTEQSVYAMNIHFSVPGEGSEMIPIVIDPSTGNGGGYEP